MSEPGRKHLKESMTVNIITRKDGKKSKKRLAGFFLASFVTLAGAGAAFAYWTAGGTGNGTAATGTTTNVTVNQTTTVAGLYPGDTIALAGTFTNTNAGSVYVTAVTASIGTFDIPGTGGAPDCTNADFTISGTAPVGAEIAHGTGGSWSGLSINMLDTALNQNTCKSLTTIPISYTSS
jgi:hypothetical protein